MRCTEPCRGGGGTAGAGALGAALRGACVGRGTGLGGQRGGLLTGPSLPVPGPQLGGCGILGVGIWLAATQGNFATLSSSFPSLSAANLLIATGTLVMAIGFVGCIGAIKENRCLLLTVSGAGRGGGLAAFSLRRSPALWLPRTLASEMDLGQDSSPSWGLLLTMKGGALLPVWSAEAAAGREAPASSGAFV